MKVLIVDDSSIIRMILKGILKQLNITDLIEASNGQEALDILSQQTVDLVLLDIHMPQLDGISCLETLKNNSDTKTLPVIIISSDTEASQLERARKLGALAYIKKPFHAENLKEAILKAGLVLETVS